jgi:hypothetical protein
MPLKSWNGPWCHDTYLFYLPSHSVGLLFDFCRLPALTCGPDQGICPKCHRGHCFLSSPPRAPSPAPAPPITTTATMDEFDPSSRSPSADHLSPHRFDPRHRRSTPRLPQRSSASIRDCSAVPMRRHTLPPAVRLSLVPMRHRRTRLRLVLHPSEDTYGEDRDDVGAASVGASGSRAGSIAAARAAAAWTSRGDAEVGRRSTVAMSGSTAAMSALSLCALPPRAPAAMAACALAHHGRRPRDLQRCLALRTPPHELRPPWL